MYIAVFHYETTWRTPVIYLFNNGQRFLRHRGPWKSTNITYMLTHYNNGRSGTDLEFTGHYSMVFRSIFYLSASFWKKLYKRNEMLCTTVSFKMFYILDSVMIINLSLNTRMILLFKCKNKSEICEYYILLLILNLKRFSLWMRYLFIFDFFMNTFLG